MRNIIRTSHEQRRRSSAVLHGEHSSLAAVAELNQRRLSSSGSLETLAQLTEKKGPYPVDSRLVGLGGCISERRRFSLAATTGYSSLNNSPKLLPRRCSHSENRPGTPPVVASASQPFHYPRKGSHPRRQKSQSSQSGDDTADIKQIKVLGVIFVICFSCVLVAVISYLCKQYFLRKQSWERETSQWISYIFEDRIKRDLRR